ncbi:hypothetical protein OG944_38550 (plasmid) [Streptomyces anulatus]|nr:hypothetical protein OG865_39165 [Streptomyces anulatus]
MVSEEDLFASADAEQEPHNEVGDVLGGWEGLDTDEDPGEARAGGSTRAKRSPAERLRVEAQADLLVAAERLVRLSGLEVISFGWLGILWVMVGIVERLVPDELWELFQRVVPEVPSRPQGGGRRLHASNASSEEALRSAIVRGLGLMPLFERRLHQGAEQISHPQPPRVRHVLQGLAIRVGQRYERQTGLPLSMSATQDARAGVVRLPALG